MRFIHTGKLGKSLYKGESSDLPVPTAGLGESRPRQERYVRKLIALALAIAASLIVAAVALAAVTDDASRSRRRRPRPARRRRSQPISLAINVGHRRPGRRRSRRR